MNVQYPEKKSYPASLSIATFDDHVMIGVIESFISAWKVFTSGPLSLEGGAPFHELCVRSTFSQIVKAVIHRVELGHASCGH